jgi:two-component system phosphate regulon sensor histidine kinase PhoR
LIENLLNLSKLDNETEVFNFEPAHGNEILKAVVELVAPRAESHSVDLQYQPCQDQWWINAEHHQIRAALTNIVDNAVKYTPGNGRVSVSAEIDRGLVKIKVADTGVGIKDEDLPHIFDRFFRVKEKATRQVTGSGLGLSLVKKVVEAHNGFIDVTSEKEKGTTFTVSFPLVDSPA